MSVPTDTIVAIATGPAPGGIGVIRLSGTNSLALASVLIGRELKIKTVELVSFRDADHSVIDKGLCLAFLAPHSYTGEDVVELHAHGGLVNLDTLLQRVLQLGGVRLARPGEFTERAFLNNKIDLPQAEAVMDLISAKSAQAAKAASRSLEGEFSRRVTDLLDRLVGIRVQVEARIDFSDEELTLHSIEIIQNDLATWLERLSELIARTQSGVRLRDGFKVVIAGRPNAGKSSLLNALLGVEAAIVSDQAGTTRDVIRERMAIAGVPIEIADTAGLREEADSIEAEGIRRARQEMMTADVILYVVDASDRAALDVLENDTAALPVHTVVVLNKVDLCDKPPPNPTRYDAIAVSVHQAHGLESLTQKIVALTSAHDDSSSVFSARRRHLQALEHTRQSVSTALTLCCQSAPLELVAEELWQAQNALSDITGRLLSDDLLGKIFGEFCIGK